MKQASPDPDYARLISQMQQNGEAHQVVPHWVSHTGSAVSYFEPTGTASVFNAAQLPSILAK